MSAFVHMELNTTDPVAAKEFYRNVFGWKTQDIEMPEGVYTMLSAAKGANIGGIQLKPMPDAPTAWLGYVGVASHADTMAKAIMSGAHVIVEKYVIPGMGTLGIFFDPQGAPVGIWEAAAQPEKKAGKKKPKQAGAKKKQKKAAKKKQKQKKAEKAGAKKKQKKSKQNS